MQTPQEHAERIVELFQGEFLDVIPCESLEKEIELAIEQRDKAIQKHLSEIRRCLIFACYDKTTLKRCGEVWQKLFAAENEFNQGAV